MNNNTQTHIVIEVTTPELIQPSVFTYSDFLFLIIPIIICSKLIFERIDYLTNNTSDDEYIDE